MGSEITPLLDFFFQDIATLHLDWYIFDQLFGHSKERVDELNQRTHHFFGRIQGVLVDRIVLTIARLLDRGTVAGKATASLAGAIQEMGLPSGDPRRTQLEEALAKLKRSCEPIIGQRHRRVAHNDRAVALGREVLAGVSRRTMRNAIEGVVAIVNSIWSIVKGGEVAFETIRNDTGVESLLKVLRAGNKLLDNEDAARRAIVQKLAKGVIPPDFDVSRDSCD